MLASYDIIDISQPVDSKTAVFPGDEPFHKKITQSFEHSKVLNLSAFTMSPHVGTHADAPVHIRGELPPRVVEHADITPERTAGQLPLAPYVGPCVVVDVSGQIDHVNGILPEHVRERLEQYSSFPPRVLFRTQKQVRYDVFEKRYTWFNTDLIHYLGQNGVQLVGLDTPSVDPTDSKLLKTHHALLEEGMAWLENLDLSQADEGIYMLIALPLKLMEVEASPVRAVLLKNR